MSILGAFDNIVQTIGDFTDIPDMISTIWNDDADVSYALQSIKSINWNKNPGYMLKMDGGGIAKYYRFQLNPQEIQQTEPFSIKIIPTQSGIVTENEGFVTKDLVIAGMTGIYPKRPGTGYLTLGKSGYEDFLTLRNFVREYAELKKNPSFRETKLIFRNYKDNEYWYVEPLSFDMNRTKDSPFTYSYRIAFKIVGKPIPPSTFLDVLSDFIGVIDNIVETVDACVETFNQFVDFLQNVEGAIETVLITPLQTASYVMGAIKQGVTTISSLPRQFYTDLLFETRRVRDNTVDMLGLGDSNYDSTYDRDVTLSGTTTTYITADNLKLLKAFTDTEKALNQFICTDKFFDESTTQVTLNNEVLGSSSIISTDVILQKQISSKQNILAMFNNEIALPTPQSVQKAIVQTNDSLERISLRYLGDTNRWIELMSLNNLKYPYIDNTLVQEGVLNPGDEILIPTDTSQDVTDSNIVSTRQTSFTKTLTEQERSLGVDLMVNSNNDLILNNRKDLELVYGFQNIEQTLRLKIGYEKGSLLYHPDVGIGLMIGEKNDLIIDELYQSIRDTIIADPRFYNVDSVRLEKNGSAVKLNLTVTLAATRKKVPMVLTF